MLKKDLIKKVENLENTVQRLRLAILHNTNIISNYTKQLSIANATIDRLENESSVIGSCSINEDTIRNIYSTIQEYRRIVCNITPIISFDDAKIEDIIDAHNTPNKDIDTDIDTDAYIVKRQIEKGYVGISDIIYDVSDNTNIEAPIFDFSLAKVLNKTSYCGPEFVSGYSLLDLFMINWSNIEPCDYESTLDRDKDYDLKRISYFIKNGIGDEPIDLEYDGQTLVINDGNHRFASLLLSSIQNIDFNTVNILKLLEECNVTFKGRLFGFQDILIDLL